MRYFLTLFVSFLLVLSFQDLNAQNQCSSSNITSATEVGLGVDNAAIISNNFIEGVLAYSDRSHEHHAAQFNSGTGILDIAGDVNVGLPEYLAGRKYIRFANNVRDNIGYSATATSDTPTFWYLLIDNRINGLDGDSNSPNTSDPVLGGLLQWVLDGGWIRVNTGISPNGQDDYTGIDEGGDGELNQFYSIWISTVMSTSVTVYNNGTGESNMIALIAGCPITFERECQPSMISSVNESNLGGDIPAIIEMASFFKNSLTYSDRTHQHSNALFDSGSGLLSVVGDMSVDFPKYLLGQGYIRFANNSRDNIDYSATITSVSPTHWYLLIDNRIHGPNGDASSPNTSDPVLGGSLQWVIDGGWQRVKTGISPDGQADYTGIDEGGDGGLNQFYSIWVYPIPSNVITVFNNGIAGTDMITLVAGCATSTVVEPQVCLPASITAVSEINLFGDAAAIIENGTYAENALAFSDRIHQHSAAHFDSGSDLLSTTGDLDVGLPSYLLGRGYIRFANNARDNADYLATVFADAPSTWYLLIDNRLDGPSIDLNSPSTTDPILGGSLQWVIDGGWQRVNSGLSPGGQADYTGIDEGGDGGLNQFYSVWSLPFQTNVVSIFNNGVVGSNMISLVAGCPFIPAPPIPTIGQWGIIILLLSFAILGVIGIYRRVRIQK